MLLGSSKDMVRLSGIDVGEVTELKFSETDHGKITYNYPSLNSFNIAFVNVPPAKNSNG